MRPPTVAKKPAVPQTLSAANGSTSEKPSAEKPTSTISTTKESKTISQADLAKNIMNNTPISGMPSILDSLIRGVGRYLEVLMESQLIRVPFRFFTEIIRYGSSRSLQDILSKKELDHKKLWITGIKKSLEITIGTAIVDPNRQTNRLVRMGTGFLNMVARTAARGGLTLAKILDKTQCGLRTLTDEFLSRTFCRIIYLDSENPIIGIGCRTLEQFGINEWIRHLPVNNKILAKLKGSSNPAN